MSAGFRLSITYRIGGRLAYLSHLETVEAMRRIVRRAQLPYAVSEGFSPHMKAAFGPALPVGASGREERFEVRLTDYVPAAQALQRLQAAAPPNLMPQACAYVDVAAPAPDVALTLSRWSARFSGGCSPQATLRQLQAVFDALLARGCIEVVKVKRGKRKVRRILFEDKLVAGPELCVVGGNVQVEFTTRQGADGALRPDLFLDEALKGAAEPPQLLALERLQLFAEEGQGAGEGDAYWDALREEYALERLEKWERS